MEGGEDAGKHLRRAVLEYSKTSPTYRADDRIFIWIYANARGLSRTYKAAKIIPDESVFEHFMTGFNRSHQFSDFVDAGPHKEAADSKIKGALSFSLAFQPIELTDSKSLLRILLQKSALSACHVGRLR